MNARIRIRRAAACALGVALAATLSFAGAAAAAADTDDRALSLTRLDGSPIGTLFTDWTMVPGDVVTATVVAHRAGGGESSLLVTLGHGPAESEAPSAPVEEDVEITVASNGATFSSSAAALLRGDVVFDLGRSASASVPIEVTFALPYESGNGSQRQSIDLSLVVTATDAEAPTADADESSAPSAAPADHAGSGADVLALPNLPSTGASVRDALIAAAAITCLGLLLIGGRRRRREKADAD